MPRIIKDLIDGTFLHNLSRIHNIYIIRHLRHNAQIVGNINNRNSSFPLNSADQFNDLCLNRHIQRCGGFVTDQKIRIAGKGNGDNHSLAHASGKLMGIILHSLFRILDSYFF